MTFFLLNTIVTFERGLSVQFSVLKRIMQYKFKKHETLTMRREIQNSEKLKISDLGVAAHEDNNNNMRLTKSPSSFDS